MVRWGGGSTQPVGRGAHFQQGKKPASPVEAGSLPPISPSILQPGFIHGVWQFIKKGGEAESRRATPLLRGTHCVLSTSQDSGGGGSTFKRIWEICFVPNVCRGVHCSCQGPPHGFRKRGQGMTSQEGCSPSVGPPLSGGVNREVSATCKFYR